MHGTQSLTNAKLGQLAEGLAALDGLRVKSDEFKPYRFDDESETAWRIASNQAIVADALRVFDRAKKLLAVQHQMAERMVITAANADQVQAFMDDLSVLEDREVTVNGLQTISREALRVGHKDGRNPIPPSVLAKLLPILED